MRKLLSSIQKTLPSSLWGTVSRDMAPYLGLMTMIHSLLKLLSEKGILTEEEAVNLTDLGTFVMLHSSDYLLQAIRLNPSLIETLKETLGDKYIVELLQYINQTSVGGPDH